MAVMKRSDVRDWEDKPTTASFIRNIHPVCKWVTTLAFILVVLSFDRLDGKGLLPYLAYSVVVLALARVPYRTLLKRCVPALPFCLLVGLSHMAYDKGGAFVVAGFAIPFGVATFLIFMLRTFLCVSAALVLVAVTPLSELSAGLRSLRVPDVLVTTFEMTYRYIGLLWEETWSAYTAYSLRRAGGRGVALRHVGSFIGTLLLRSLDRAERVYCAMLGRGYGVRQREGPYHGKGWSRVDVAYCLVACTLFVALRIVEW